MSVIVVLSVPAARFELGRIPEMEDGASIVLETMVPLGERSIPFFRLRDGDGSAFERRVRDHPAVDELQAVNSQGEGTLYALDWEMADDEFLAGVMAVDAHVLEATGTGEDWVFELRFPSHDRLSAFQDYCVDADIDIDVERMYNPTRPDAGPWYGLTGPQRETLVRAVEAGYYAIPRQCSTQALADELGVSDQAVTERLRRAIRTLASNTLLLQEE